MEFLLNDGLPFFIVIIILSYFKRKSGVIASYFFGFFGVYLIIDYFITLASCDPDAFCEIGMMMIFGIIFLLGSMISFIIVWTIHGSIRFRDKEQKV